MLMPDLHTKSEFIEWLGPVGVEFFSELYGKHGEIPLVIPSDIPGVPHPIHFREGMQVHNWMRNHTDLPEEQIENNWREFIGDCLDLNLGIWDFNRIQ